MGKKKKGSGKSKKKAAKAADAPPAEKFMELPPKQEVWVKLHFKLKSWEFLDEVKLYKTSTRLFALIAEIGERHGVVEELKLYKDSFAGKNLLAGKSLTLDELGIVGVPLPEGKNPNDDDVEVPVVEIHYDFTPKDYDCPLLLVSPR